MISHTKHFSSLDWTWILLFSSDGRQVRSGIGASWTWAIGLQRTVQCNEHCCFLFVSLKELHQRRDLLLLYYIKNKVKELVYTETERKKRSTHQAMSLLTCGTFVLVHFCYVINEVWCTFFPGCFQSTVSSTCRRPT